MQRYQPLFTPIKIGPVTSPNRFMQVAHCNGMGYRYPKSLAAMRGVKAEGGWGIVCTEEIEIHQTSDLAPFHEGRIWQDSDLSHLRMMVEAVKAYGSLAAIELVHGGINATNWYSRLPPLGPKSVGVTGGNGYNPVQSKRMDKKDIRNLIGWYKDAAVRARDSGFDIVYCYAGHGLTLPMQFMMRRYNDRTDEYGGSLSNRVRLFRQIIEETKSAIGDRCAVAVRLAVDELLGDDGISAQGEGYDIVAMLAELPDLWDVNISGWSNDSATSRFAKEGYQEQYTSFVKNLTTKPVVGVGRYTSPDTMLSAIERGVLDIIGAARPSIADPFLPRKIREDRLEDIRECIGCNICVSGDLLSVPLRCTQNPTIGEEWRRGWHPEVIERKGSEKEILVIGAGPAGLECARALGQRGYQVTLAEAGREIGGRVIKEARLPGLSEWRRVIEWRLSPPQQRSNLTIYPESKMSAADVIETGIRNVIIATGSRYRRDGVGRSNGFPIPGFDGANVFTPDDIMAGKNLTGRILIYDDDHYYMASVLAEKLATQPEKATITIVTPAPQIAYWSNFTLEQARIQKRMRVLKIDLITDAVVTKIDHGEAFIQQQDSEDQRCLPFDALLTVTDRLPNDLLYHELLPFQSQGQLDCLKLIGDAEAPGTIAHAVYAGHLAAREFDSKLVGNEPPFSRE